MENQIRIAEYIHLYQKRVGGKVEDAFRSAMDLFDVSWGTVTGAWRQFRDSREVRRLKTAKIGDHVWHYFEELKGQRAQSKKVM